MIFNYVVGFKKLNEMYIACEWKSCDYAVNLIQEYHYHVKGHIPQLEVVSDEDGEGNLYIVYYKLEMFVLSFAFTRIIAALLLEVKFVMRCLKSYMPSQAEYVIGQISCLKIRLFLGQIPKVGFDEFHPLCVFFLICF